MYGLNFLFSLQIVQTKYQQLYQFLCQINLFVIDFLIKVIHIHITLPQSQSIFLRQSSYRMNLTITYFFPSKLAIQMKRLILFLFNETSFYYLNCALLDMRGLLLQKIFEHIYNISMQKEQKGKEQEFNRLQLSTLLERAYDCQIHVVGAIKEIFQHKRYIVELSMSGQIVLRCLKRYNQFQALHQVLQMNFKNIDLGLPQFPSKFQILNKQQNRRSYFEEMLNKIMHVYLQKITNETNRRLLSTLFVFLVGNQPKKLKSELTREANTQTRKSSDSIDNSLDFTKEKFESAYQFDPQSEIKKKSQLKSQQSKRKGSQQLGEQATLRLFMSTEFLIQFSGEKDWKQRYLKLQGTCLLIYKHKNQNHFKSKIQLFQAQIQYLHRQKNIFDHFCQKMELDNEPLFPEDTTLLTISHEHDYKKLVISIKTGQRMQLKTVKQLLTKASRQKLGTQIEGVFSPIGKLFIILHKIIFNSGNPKTLPIVYLRMRTSGLIYQTKRMTYAFNTPLNIKQTFMIPISNAFANILVEVIMIQNDGIIRHQSAEKCIGYFKISFADFLSYPSGYGLERVHAKIEHEEGYNQVYQGIIQLTVVNYSHYSSMYADSFANQNDGIIMTGLKSTSDTQQLVITVDRVLRVIGNIALFITAFWRNVYLYKYPRMSYTFFSILIIIFNFGSAFHYFRFFLYSFIFVMLYHLPPSRKIILLFMDNYIFNHIHTNFHPPLCLSSNELKFLQWTTNLKKIKTDYKLTLNGKLEKSQSAKDKKYEQWSFTIHDKTFNIREQCPSLLEKVFQVKKIIELVLRMISAAINTLQKVFNVLSWADPRRSIIIFCILLFISNVANTYIFQAIGTIFCIHRLYKGISFYKKKHYFNNRKLAVFSLRYILNQQFNFLLPNKKIESINQTEVEELFRNIYFPLRDEDRLKKLKQSIQHILGIYIDEEELNKKEQKTKQNKNTFAIIHLIDIIQTCQARLKLQWISGLQGSTDSFQELKKLTNQELVIDLWVESLLINFFLNIPSQLYTTFRSIRSKQSLNLEAEAQQKTQLFKKVKL